MVDAAEPVAGVQLHLLGPLELVVRGRAVVTGGPRQRALLAVLGLSAGTAVPPSRLVDLLWDEEPPPAATNTVQVYVSRLRRMFAAAGIRSPLRNVSGMYLLDLPPEAVDVRRFEVRSERGRGLLAAGDAVAAADELRLALAIWRGTPLPDLDTTVVGRATVARLESMRLATLADRIDADALLGRSPALVPELEGLVLRHPLDERLVGQLMTALYRTGRQAEAFAAYRAASERLADELGVDPGPALRALHTRILRQDPGLDRPPAPRPVPAVAGPGTPDPRPSTGSAGWTGPGSPGSPGAPGRAAGPRVPAARTPPSTARVPAPAGVPAVERVPAGLAAGALIGRRAELATALDLVRRPEVRLITVLGPGGAGKTRLAAEVAALLAAPPAAPGGREVAGPAPLRVVRVPLASVTDAAQVPAEICRVLRAEPGWPGECATDLAVRALGDEPALLVLDNLEQLAGSGLKPVRELVERTARLTVMCTSRAVLGLPGERLLPVGPLPLPPAGAGPGEVIDADAVRLFRERARAVLPTFEVTATNAVAVAALCRGLDGLPLALELAAARVRVLPPDEILARLDRRLELLAGGAPHLPERQRSMAGALDWSARLLDPAERLLFGQLSVFDGGWTLDAAEEVCAGWDGADAGGPFGPDEGDDLDVVGVISRLVDKSLVIADGTGRLGMLQTVRDYAGELLASQPELAARTRRRHATFYAGLVEDLGLQAQVPAVAAAGPSPQARLDRESGNLALALDHVAAEPGPTSRSDRTDQPDQAGEILDRLVTGLHHWFAAGRPDSAGALDPEAPGRLARPLVSLARDALARGAGDDAQALAAQALAAAAAGGSARLLAEVMAAAALVDLRTGRRGRAIARLREAIRLGHDCGQLQSLPEMVALLGAAMSRSDPAAATRLLAAARSWRSARRTAAVGGCARIAVAEAEAELAVRARRADAERCDELGSAAMERERERGARTPFGSLRGLSLLDPGLLGPAGSIDLSAAVIDLRAVALPRR